MLIVFVTASLHIGQNNNKGIASSNNVEGSTRE